MNRMLTFCPKLYLGEGIKKKNTDKIKKKLLEKPLHADVYLIALAHGPAAQLECFDARQLAQRFYENHPLQVVGIAKDYADALRLVEQITKECLSERGDCKLKEYLIC